MPINLNANVEELWNPCIKTSFQNIECRLEIFTTIIVDEMFLCTLREEDLKNSTL